MIDRLRRVLAVVCQVICWPLFWVLAYVICRARVRSQFSFPSVPNARFVIAANHQAKLDAFVITGVISPRFWRLLPYRYVTANQYLYKPSLVWLLWPLGGFPAYQTSREGWGLAQAKLLVKIGQTVCIFPEGQRALKGEVEPKRGVGVLASLPNVYVIPINLRWHFNKRRVDVVIGRAYQAKGQTSSDILQSIYNLQE